MSRRQINNNYLPDIYEEFLTRAAHNLLFALNIRQWPSIIPTILLFCIWLETPVPDSFLRELEWATVL